MTKAIKGNNVKVHYTGSLDDGSIFDSSKDRDPLEFEIGKGQVIKGFEEGVSGMAVGDVKKIHIAPEDAYGPYHEEMTTSVERSQLPEGMNPEIDQMLQMQTPDGQVIQVRVAEINDDSVKLDANHPLAGKALNFELELMAIQ